MRKSDWEELGWDVGNEHEGCFSITRSSDVTCTRCGEPGPWTLRMLPNQELAYRDYAVCRCGELAHVNMVWPGIARP